jgi:hypothetical protein
VIVNVWVWPLSFDVVIISLPPASTACNWACVMLKVCVWPPADEVNLAIPAAGGVSTSDLEIEIVWLCPESVEDVNVCEVDGFGGGVGELESESEQPHARRARHARTPSNKNRLLAIPVSFRWSLGPTLASF